MDAQPCGGPTFGLQVVIAVLAALNVALAAWLSNRRLQADKRENGQGCKMVHMDQPDHELRPGSRYVRKSGPGSQ